MRHTVVKFEINFLFFYFVALFYYHTHTLLYNKITFFGILHVSLENFVFFVRFFLIQKATFSEVSKVNDLYLFHDINLARLKPWKLGE